MGVGRGEGRVLKRRAWPGPGFPAADAHRLQAESRQILVHSVCDLRAPWCELNLRVPTALERNPRPASQQVKGGDEDAPAGTGGPKELEGKPNPACPGLGYGGPPGPLHRSRELLGSQAAPHADSRAGLGTFRARTFE